LNKTALQITSIMQ